ncbi:MAG: TetR/AcrR family transcriptional regulator [Bacteroidota bacterium]
MDEAKEKLLLEAGGLFRRYGLKSVSMDDVSRHLGMSKKTLYQYVSSKEDLISQVLEQKHCEEMEVTERIAKESVDAIDEFLQHSRFFIGEMRDVSPTTMYDMKKYYSHIWEKQMLGKIDEFVAGIEINLARGIKEGLFRSDFIPGIIAKIYAQTVMAITDITLFPGREIPIDRTIREHAIYHLYGVVTDLGRQRLKEHLERQELY